jgi:N-acetylneuraminate synthase
MLFAQLFDDRPFVIAEAGVNHNGSLERALQMVDAAAEAGADAIKFQTFVSGELASRRAGKAPYQAVATGDDTSQLEMLRGLELDAQAHRQLKSRAEHRRLRFLSTPFDRQSLVFLAQDLDLPLLKLGSGEITNAPLLVAAAATRRPVILSTGMSTLEEVRLALGALAFGYTSAASAPGVQAFAAAFASAEGRAALASNVVLLHCTSQYPAAVEDANLRAIGTLRDAFGVRVGYSDHTLGNATAYAAVALGACAIEKHFTLDPMLPGPDHRASATTAQLAELVRGVAQVHRALGSPDKAPVAGELPTRAVARRSLTAARAIAAGERFSDSNLVAKRPGDGVSPMQYWEWLGRTAQRDFAEDDRIE